MNVRLIARLDIKGPNLVKGIQLEGLRVLGRPEDFARYYYEHGADELLYMDVVASLYERNSLTDIIERTSREVFIPLTVGGGLRTLDDIRAALSAGADKVAVNTAAIRRPGLISEAANRFGASTVVVSIEAKRLPDGRYEAFVDNGRQRTGRDVFEWAVQAADLGAGEIMITSIDREGTGDGFDLELTRRMAECVPVPVIACGGAGKIAHVRDVARDAKADAVALASLLHYNARDDATGQPLSRSTFERIESCSFPEIRSSLHGEGVPCRTPGHAVHPASRGKRCAADVHRDKPPTVAIIDYGTGNLASVKLACEHVGLHSVITHRSKDLASADAILLPGVGAFADAMKEIHRHHLAEKLQDAAASGRPLLGICLGMQLLFSASLEFGRHLGLGLIDGEVIPLKSLTHGGRRWKVPHVGWNEIHRPDRHRDGWTNTPFDGLCENEQMYFIHSYHACPVDASATICLTRFADREICSAVRDGSVLGLQFHPERSGPAGMSIYQRWADFVRSRRSAQIKSLATSIR